MSMSPEDMEQFAEIIKKGGSIVCNAWTLERLLATAKESGRPDTFIGVRFRILQHLPNGRIAAVAPGFTESLSLPYPLTTP
jgi:precorrin-6B methylase 2